MSNKTRNIFINLFRLVFRLFLVFLVITSAIFLIKTIQFPSRQITVEAAEAVDVSDDAIQRLSKAITFSSISRENGIDTSAFLLLDTFIQKKYPLVDSLLEKEKVNGFSYLYKWAGKNPKLKPVLLMGHLDVVPVEADSKDQWMQDPFGGKAVDGAVWGRGTMDDKSSVFGIIEAVTALLKEDHLPDRTIYLAFGHDEEVSGMGAKATAALLEKRGVELEFILDEGSCIIKNAVAGLEAPLALIGIAEKGYVTLNLTANLDQGGHSSMPPAQTAISVLSEAIYKLQQYPFPAKIDGAVADMFDHIGPEMGTFNKTLFANLWLTEGLITNQFSKSPQSNAMIRTTMAPTMLRGGIKDNVLPTTATAKINFRILPGESIATTIDYVRRIINDNRILVIPSENKMKQNPSVVSDTESYGFELIQKTIKEIFPEVVVAPSLVVAATDSRHYANLSKSIYRFQPLMIEKSETSRFHGIDEQVSIENYKNMIRFYRQVILNTGLK